MAEHLTACTGSKRSSGRLIGVSAALCAALFGTNSALADFRICNNTGSRIGISIGYKDPEHWTTEGWWNLSARTCETIVRGPRGARYFYLSAVDYDRSGEWAGRAFMCTREKEFTIRGTEDCLARGYDRTGFFEVDTGEQGSWTVQLTDSADQAPQMPLQSRVPLLTVPSTGGRQSVSPTTVPRRN